MCKTYQQNNLANCEYIVNTLKELFLDKIIKYVEFDEVKEFGVYENLQADKKITAVSKVFPDQIMCVPNFNIYLLYSDSNYGELLKQITNIIENRLNSTLQIIDVKFDNIRNYTYFVLKDEFYNKYNLYIMNLSDYVEQQSGAVSDEINDIFDNDELDDLESDLIKVKTRSGEVKYIQRGSTVLDFAFKIHKDIGFGFKYAKINDSKTQNPPYTKLLENDTIEIIVDKNSDGTIKQNAQIKWFAYVQTELAKKCLVKHFESKYTLKRK